VAKQRTRGNAEDRAAAVAQSPKRVPAPKRNTAVGLPVFDLKGGPYDGLDTEDEAIATTLFFPSEVHVGGDHGPAVYLLEGQTGTYDRPN